MTRIRAWFQESYSRRPLAWVSPFACLGACLLRWPSSATVLISLIAFVAGWVFLSRRQFLTCFGIALVAFSLGSWQESRAKFQQDALSMVAPAALSGRVVTPPQIFPQGGWQAIVQTETPIRARVQWRESGEIFPKIGDRLVARGEFRLAELARNPAEFDSAAWFSREDIRGIWQTREASERRPISRVARFFQRVRNSFHEGITHGLAPASDEAAIIRAVVAGTYPRDAEPLVNAFRLSGTLHAFSVSGMHVVLVGAMAWFVLARIRLSRSHAAPILILLLFGYAWITGNSAPAQRAAWMGTLVLAAFVLRRRADLLNTLGALWLYLCLFEGECLSSISVQLSYLSVFGLGVVQEKFVATLKHRWHPDANFLPLHYQKSGRWQRIKESLILQSLAGVGAWGSTAPLVAWEFGLITPIALIASILLAPLFSALLALGLLAWLTFVFSPNWAGKINQLNAHIAHVTYRGADAFARLPGASFRLARGEPAQLVVFDLPLGGAGNLLHTRDGCLMLDTGSARAFHRSVLPYLNQLLCFPDSLILSHGDTQHLGAATEFLARNQPKQILLPREKSRSSSQRAWLHATSAIHFAENAPMLAGPDGSRIEIFSSSAPAQSIADDQAMIVRITWHSWRFLFLSDSGYSAQQELLARGITADVVILGKHSKEGFPAPGVVAAFSPQVVVIPRILNAPNYQAPHVFQQQTCGAVRFLPREKSPEILEIRTSLDQKSVLLSRENFPK